MANIIFDDISFMSINVIYQHYDLKVWKDVKNEIDGNCFK